MSLETDTRDRVIKVAADLEHLTEKVEEMSATVSDLRDLLQQAKGVRWLIIVMATIGGFIASKVGAILPWLSIPPR